MEIPGIDLEEFQRERALFATHDDGITLFAAKYCGTIFDKQQKLAARNLKKYGRLAIAAAHSTGKSRFAICCAFWFLFCFRSSRVIITAPTVHQSYGVLMTEAQLVQNNSILLQALFEITKTQIFVRQGKLRTNVNVWRADIVPSRDSNSVQGRHREFQMFIVDEAPGINEQTFEAIEGCCAGIPQKNPILMLGNPTRLQGYFHKVFKFPDKWKTQHMDAFNSEHVEGDYIERIANRYGKKSNVYRVRVLGQFPDHSDEYVISYTDVSEAIYREDVVKSDKDYIQFGLDVAMTGKNLTVLCIRRGNEILKYISEQISDDESILEMVRREFMEFYNNGEWPRYIVVDATGVGEPIFHQIRRYCATKLYNKNPCQVICFKGGENAFDKIYSNKRAECYYRFAKTIKEIKFPTDQEDWGTIEPDIIAGLSSVKSYFNIDDQLCLIDKRELIGKSKTNAKGEKLTKSIDDDTMNVQHLDYADATTMAYWLHKKIEQPGSGSGKATYHKLKPINTNSWG